MNRSDKILAWAVTTFLLLLCAAVILPSLAKSRESVAVIRALPFGWISFLGRTLPEVTTNWAGIGMVVLCSALILLSLHWLLNALTRRRFRFRWSLSIFAAVWLLFCLIIAVAGLNGTAAMLKNEKWFAPRSGYGDLRMASLHARMALNDAPNDLTHLKRLLLESEGRFGKPVWEDFEFLICPAENSVLVVVIPREPRTRQRVGFSIVGDSNSADYIPSARLPEKLVELRKSVPPVADDVRSL